MPLYELTLITRPLAKPDLLRVLLRAGNVLLDHGGVIEKCESLGHRDMPFKRLTKQSKQPVYSTNYFLFRAHLSKPEYQKVKQIVENDLDLLHSFFHDVPTPEYDLFNEFPREKEFECDLEELLKPAPERAAVKQLRDEQKLGMFARLRIHNRARREWNTIPKSYPITPPRE